LIIDKRYAPPDRGGAEILMQAIPIAAETL
jgi:hypothetical protein